MDILITGTSSGLGHGMATAALEDGHSVWGGSRRTPEDLCNREGFAFARLDLEDMESIGPTLGSLLEGVSHLDLVVLNAGQLGEIGDMADTDMEALRSLMAVNTWSNKSILDSLQQQDITMDRVVAISSGAAVNGHRGWNGYAISKAALNTMVKLYAAEMTDTHFISLAPGLVDTAMQDYLCGMKNDPRYASLETLRAARGTPAMPGPLECGRMIMDLLPRLSEFPSGSYVDVREL